VAARRSEVPLTQGQLNHLRLETRFRSHFGRAFEWAITVPVAIWMLGSGLAGLVGWIPLIGWVGAFWGYFGAILLGVPALVLTPLLALLLLPVSLLRIGPRIRRDIAGGVATRLEGTFAVTDNGSGGTLEVGDASYDLDAGQIDSLRPPADGAAMDEWVVSGAIVCAPSTNELLAVYGDRGELLIDLTGTVALRP
jgi:hypothetical protein